MNKDFEYLLHAHFVPVLMGICDVSHKDSEVLGESAGSLLHGLDSITIIANNHRLNSLALELIDLDIGDLLSKGRYNSYSGIVV